VRKLQELEAQLNVQQSEYVPLAPKGTPEAGELAQARTADGQAASGIRGQALYPGESIRALYWDNPLAYEPRSSLEAALVQGFSPVDPASAAKVGTLASPSRIVIPAIDVDSPAAELEILDLGDSRAYETPKYVVGHIPETARPGERGTGWYFGHLESPIRGEGSVFRDLPKIPELLRQGEDVYVIIGNGTTDYLYRVSDFQILAADELKLQDTGQPSVFLVTCIPRFYYDYRLVIKAVLVGTRAAAS
jgi:sortase (surface protein transpeptidase)